MDLKEFKNAAKPAKQRSKLAPFKAAILDLTASDYTLKQIQDFLRANGLNVSLQAISKFLRKHAKAQTPPTAGAAASPQEIQPATDAPLSKVETARKASIPSPTAEQPATDQPTHGEGKRTTGLKPLSERKRSVAKDDDENPLASLAKRPKPKE
jgi:hypothetical protein